MQNSDPTKLYYNLYDMECWLPYIRNDIYPHSKETGDYENFKKWYNKTFNDTKGAGPMADDNERIDLTKDVKLTMKDHKIMG